MAKKMTNQEIVESLQMIRNQIVLSHPAAAAMLKGLIHFFMKGY